MNNIPIREAWKEAWRLARIRNAAGETEEAYKLPVLEWLAFLRINNRDQPDSLDIPVQGRLIAKQIIDEILAESSDDATSDLPGMKL